MENTVDTIAYPVVSRSFAPFCDPGENKCHENTDAQNNHPQCEVSIDDSVHACRTTNQFMHAIGTVKSTCNELLRYGPVSRGVLFARISDQSSRQLFTRILSLLFKGVTKLF